MWIPERSAFQADERTRNNALNHAWAWQAQKNCNEANQEEEEDSRKGIG